MSLPVRASASLPGGLARDPRGAAGWPDPSPAPAQSPPQLQPVLRILQNAQNLGGDIGAVRFLLNQFQRDLLAGDAGAPVITLAEGLETVLLLYAVGSSSGSVAGARVAGGSCDPYERRYD